MALQAFYDEGTIARRLSFSNDDDDDDMDAWACYSFMMDNDHTIQVYAAREVTDPDTLKVTIIRQLHTNSTQVYPGISSTYDLYQSDPKAIGRQLRAVLLCLLIKRGD
jgi:hypothetical protein